MTKQFHGITSLSLAAIGAAIAAIALFRTSWALGIVYLAICVVGSWTILRVYCAKCLCKEHCAHVLPGKAAMAFNRQPGPYQTTELFALTLALLSLIGFPQIWLWRYSGLFVAYWILNAIAFLQIRLVVCQACSNLYCPLRKKPARSA